MAEKEETLSDMLAAADAEGVREVPAIALIMLGHSANNTANSWCELWQREKNWRMELQAELAVIHDRMANLIQQPYAPSESALRRVMTVDNLDIAAWQRAHPEAVD